MPFALKRTGTCRFPESCGRGCGRAKSSVVLSFGGGGELLMMEGVAAVGHAPSVLFFLILRLDNTDAGGSAFTFAGAFARRAAM